MDHSENDKRFCVYVHKDQEGNVRYIGSGTIKRAYSKNKRSAEHIELFPSLNIEIIASDLTKTESLSIELDLYNLYKDSGILLNRKEPCSPNEILYEVFNEHFYYDPTSPSGLRWKRHNGSLYHKTARNAGDIAGSYKRGQYYQVNLFGKRYQVHRIIWCLCNKLDIPQHMIIDHIDRNKSNNNIGNLKLTSCHHNNINKNIYKNNKSSVRGVYWNKRDKAWIVTWKVNLKDNHKYFTVGNLFPEIDFEIAKSLAFDLAVNFRLKIEKEIYGI